MRKKEIFTGVAFLVIAACSLVFAVICPTIFYENHASRSYVSGTRVSYKSYGGDAYTGIQNAAADAANNIISAADEIGDTLSGLGESVATTATFVFLITSFAFASVGISKLMRVKQNGKSNAARSSDEITERNAQMPLSTVDALVKYKELVDRGVITKEEFDEKRKELLSR